MKPTAHPKQLARPAFELAMADRFIERSGMTRADAIDYAKTILVDFLADEGIEFSDAEYGWSRVEAIDYADTDLSYWEG